MYGASGEPTTLTYGWFSMNRTITCLMCACPADRLTQGVVALTGPCGARGAADAEAEAIASIATATGARTASARSGWGRVRMLLLLWLVGNRSTPNCPWQAMLLLPSRRHPVNKLCSRPTAARSAHRSSHEGRRPYIVRMLD